MKLYKEMTKLYINCFINLSHDGKSKEPHLQFLSLLAKNNIKRMFATPIRKDI